MIDLLLTGEHIKSLVRGKGITTRELMDALGITSKQSVYKWYRGETLPSIDNLVVLSRMLDVTIDDLLVII